MTKDEQLKSITDYIEYANLQFVEPFSLISSTVVEASYWTGISKETILKHINRTFKAKYGEKYIKSQAIAHKIAMGENLNADKIMAKSLDKSKEPKERKEREATTEIGKAFKEYTGLTSKANRGLYVACNNYYNKYHEFPWLNKKKWDRMCKRNNFVDNKEEKKDEV